MVGLVIPIKVYSLALSLPSLVFMAVCWKMPESPIWLMRRGREEEARATLQWLRGEAYNTEPEVKELEAVRSGEQMKSDKTVMELLKERSFIIPQLLTCVVFIFQVKCINFLTCCYSLLQATCGCDVIAYYNGVIFSDAGVQPQYAAIIYQVMRSSCFLLSTSILRLDYDHPGLSRLSSDPRPF